MTRDFTTFNPPLVHDYLIEVDGADMFNTQKQTYILSVQNPVSFVATVTPAAPVVVNDGTTISRTFVFDLTLSATNPTDPYFTIDFGDNKLIALPTLISGLAAQISYVYEFSGIYNVVITVFNKVSSSTFNFTVKIKLYKFD